MILLWSLIISRSRCPGQPTAAAPRNRIWLVALSGTPFKQKQMSTLVFAPNLVQITQHTSWTRQGRLEHPNELSLPTEQLLLASTSMQMPERSKLYAQSLTLPSLPLAGSMHRLEISPRRSRRAAAFANRIKVIQTRPASQLSLQRAKQFGIGYGGQGRRLKFLLRVLCSYNRFSQRADFLNI